MNKWVQRVLVMGWIPTLMVVMGMGWATPTPAQERTPIKVTRIYTGDDGKTHAEELELPLTQERATTESTEWFPATRVRFRRGSPDYFVDWHTAPRRQFVVTLSGESEVEIGDGTKIRLHPGTSCWRRI